MLFPSASGLRAARGGPDFASPLDHSRVWDPFAASFYRCGGLRSCGADCSCELLAFSRYEVLSFGDDERCNVFMQLLEVIEAVACGFHAAAVFSRVRHLDERAFAASGSH